MATITKKDQRSNSKLEPALHCAPERMSPPPSSRLLTNLLSYDKTYTSSLRSLLSPPPSHALAAYAASSPPPLSHVLLEVAGAIGNADEALGRYADAVDGCRELLRGIREMEEEVGSVLRDREILVTRLIKASKSTKNLKASAASQRDSLHLFSQTQLPHSPSGSSISLSSAFSSPSPSQNALAHANPPISSTNPKLTSAQAELQACEATLAMKERALRDGRVGALKAGLGLRCQAMVECGWVWGEMGREALKVIEALDSEGRSDTSAGMSDHGHPSFQTQIQGNRHTSASPPAHEYVSVWLWFLLSLASVFAVGAAIWILSSVPVLFRSAGIVPLLFDLDFGLFDHGQAFVFCVRGGCIAIMGRLTGGLDNGSLVACWAQYERLAVVVVLVSAFALKGHLGTSKNHHLTQNQKRSSYIADKPLPPAHDQPQHQQQYDEYTPTQTYYIPPAHAISDTEPFPSSSTSHQQHLRHVLARRITEEDLLRKNGDSDDGGSSAEEPVPDVRVVDNPRFFKPESTPAPAPAPAPTTPAKGHSPFKLMHGHKQEQSQNTPAAFPSTPSPKKGLLGRKLSTSQRSPPKEGGGSGFFGSIRGLFGGGGGASASQQESPAAGALGPAFYESPSARDSVDHVGSPGKSGLFGRKGKGKEKSKGWETRTEKNLRELEREPMKAGPATDAYAHMRESVRGRGRVVSDTVHAAPRLLKNVASGSGGEGEASGESSHGGAGGGGGARKLKKGRSPPPQGKTPARKKSRSASVPPPVVSAPIPIPAPTPLFAGTEIEKQFFGQTQTRPGPSQPPPQSQQTHASRTDLTPSKTSPHVIKRQKSARKPPPPVQSPQTHKDELGVHEGLTVMVVGSANPHTNAQLGRRASLTHTPASGGGGGSGLARGDSVRSTASAPVGAGRSGKAKAKAKRASLLETGNAMPSLLSVVGDASDNLAARSAVRHQRRASTPSSPAKSQEFQLHSQPPLQTPYPSTAKSAGGSRQHVQVVEMEVPRAPPRVGEVLQGQERPEDRKAEWPDIRAPGSVFDRVGGIEGVPASSSLGSAFGGGGAGVGGRADSPGSSEGRREGGKETRPAKSPLRSALRNPSRTPSPMPQLHLQSHPRQPESYAHSYIQPLPQMQPGRGSPGLNVAALGPVVPAEVPQDRRVSMGSNDSGDDVFYEAMDGTEEVEVPAPPRDARRHSNVPASASQTGANGSSGAAQEEEIVPEPRRRKSVRVSLNPTFSATPPAIDYDGDEDPAQPWASGSGWGNGATANANGNGNGNGHAYGGEPGAGGKATWGKARERDRETPDMWEDSSDEDVEYARARSLLSRLGGKEKAKGKTKNSIYLIVHALE
ncbi:hypothetical protein DXG01_004294 [Tephrocybe rancida]|nr:hypothetical protein DXG01_004294 [Tephrocybe rancida]